MTKLSIVRLAVILLLFLFKYETNANTINDSTLFKKEYNTIVLIGVGYPFAKRGSEFFETFTEYFEAENITIKALPSFFFRFKGEFIDNFRFGLNVEYFRYYINESYYVEYNDSFGEGWRDYSQNLSASNLPIMAIAEYIPFDDLPYRSYIGSGFGLNISTVKWVEEYSSSLRTDRRRGGEHFNEIVYAPSFKIFSGLELKFDKNSVQNFVNSLVIELNFLYNYVEADLFEKVSDQFRPTPEALNSGYSIFPYTITFDVGLTLNFDPKTK